MRVPPLGLWRGRTTPSLRWEGAGLGSQVQAERLQEGLLGPGGPGMSGGLALTAPPLPS